MPTTSLPRARLIAGAALVIALTPLTGCAGNTAGNQIGTTVQDDGSGATPTPWRPTRADILAEAMAEAEPAGSPCAMSADAAERRGDAGTFFCNVPPAGQDASERRGIPR